METDLCPDRSEEVVDWATPGEDLCTEEFQAKGEQGKTYVSMFKGEFEVKQRGGSSSDPCQVFNYPGLSQLLYQLRPRCRHVFFTISW